MVELKKLKCYINWEMTDTTRGVLLVEDYRSCHIVKFEDGEIHELDDLLPKVITEDMIAHFPVDVSVGQTICVRGNRNLFDTHAETRTIFSRGKKSIRARLVAFDLDELMNKVSIIKRNMAVFGVKDTTCYWDNSTKMKGKISKSEEDEQLRQIFDRELEEEQKITVERRLAEMQMVRLENSHIKC